MLKGPGFYGKDFAIIKSGIDATIERMKRILMTIPGERVGNPNFGSRFKYYMISPIEDIQRLSFIIKEDIEQWEPTVSVDDVQIRTNFPEQHVASITIAFTIKDTGETINYNLEF